MVKILLLLFFCIGLAVATYGQGGDFYDRVLSDENCRNCNFIVLNVESNAFVGRVVILNNELFDFLRNTKGIDKTKYKELVGELLRTKKALFLENAQIDENGLYLKVANAPERAFRVIKDPSASDPVYSKVDDVASRGCVPFIEYYFLGRPLNKLDKKGPEGQSDCWQFIQAQKERLLLRNLSFGEEEQNLIVSKLFECQVPSRIDDLSTLIVIDKK